MGRSFGSSSGVSGTDVFVDGIVDDVIAGVAIAHSTEFMVARRSVMGFRLSPFGLIEFYGVSLK